MGSRSIHLDAVFDIAVLAAQKSPHWNPDSDNNWLSSGGFRRTIVVETGNPDLLPAISEALERQGYVTDAFARGGIGVCLVAV